MTNSVKHRQVLEDILPLVERPSRYLGNEVNSIHKNLNDVKLRVALAFPDLYEIGTSHFGLQILYSLLNQEEHIAAERVFAPAQDLEAQLRQRRLPLGSLESATPLNEFDIIGFSLLYELNFTNVLTILELAGIPFLTSQRDQTHPFLIAGGPCMVNPEPVADFFDAVVIGDGEEVILEMTRDWHAWRDAGDGDKAALLKTWSLIEGVYIPSFLHADDQTERYQKLTPKFESHAGVKRRILASLDPGTFPTDPVVPYGKPVHDRLRLEISRGCTRGCRFCQAGMIYRPVRERSPKQLLALADQSLAETGYEDLSLLSLSTGDYGCIVSLMDQLMGRYAGQHVAVSLPSLRAGTLSPQLMHLIKKVRKTGFTIAPEAGSQRLRDVINKNITEQDIIQTVTDAFHLGWKVIKLYFMIGLPTETDEDVAAIVDLVKRLRTIKNDQGRFGQINVSVATFIPKPHTPFQWASQIPLSESKRKIGWLKAQLKLPGVKFKWQQPEVSAIEGLWARGDRRLSRLLTTAYALGCRFDGWSDQFKFDRWLKALAQEKIDLDAVLTRQRDLGEPMPWDHVDIGTDRQFLENEWQQALKGQTIDDCRTGECSGCGVCDFELIEPKIAEPDTEARQAGVTPDPAPTTYPKLMVTYQKMASARFLGHLELANIFIRALRRAKIAVKYSEGFHPMPRIAFEDPLPIGMESLQERFFLTVRPSVSCADLSAKLNQLLPPGITITACERLTVKPAAVRASHVTYRMTLKGATFDPQKLRAFEQAAACVVKRTGRKRKNNTIDLKQVVTSLVLKDPHILEMTTTTEPGKMLRPYEISSAIFDLPEDILKLARIVKLPASNVG